MGGPSVSRWRGPGGSRKRVPSSAPGLKLLVAVPEYVGLTWMKISALRACFTAFPPDALECSRLVWYWSMKKSVNRSRANVLTAAHRREVAALAALPDDKIDYS